MDSMAVQDTRLQLHDIPVMNFGKYMIDKMAAYKHAEAMVDGETGKTYSYADVISRSERLAAGLQTLGLDAGDVVCTLALNHLDYPVTFYATALLAAVFRPVNPSYTEDEIYRVLEESETRVLFTTLNLLPSISKAKRYLKHLQVILLGNEKDCKTLNDALEPQETPFRGIDSILATEGTDYTTPKFNWKSQTAVLLPSGGTTGFPKAIQLSHFALIANGMQMSYAGMSVAGETLVVFLPLSHGFGLVTIAATSHSNGCKLIMMPRYEKNDYLRLIKRYKPTVLHVVPPILTKFAKDPIVGDFDFSSLKRIFCGGSPLSSEIEMVIKNKLNLTFIQQGYGMTEAGVTHVNKTSQFRGKSVGNHMDLVEVKIVDVDTGESLGPNRPGEVWLKGPQVAIGYLNLPAHNKDTFLKDGWVRTGDIGKEDDDGFLYIIDRIKDLITHEKKQFAPATLEDILLRHEAVADAAIIGVPDVEAGELPRAYIVLKMGMAVTETELQDFVAGLVDDFMRLRGGVMFVNEIPRSPSGKILRRNIRKAIGLL